MMIKCNECGVSVSDKAQYCPKCGGPISAAKKSEIKSIGDAPITTQSTSKHLKGLSLMFMAMLVVGFILVVMTAADTTPGESVSIVPGLLVAVGLIGYIITRVRIWWHHG